MSDPIQYHEIGRAAVNIDKTKPIEVFLTHLQARYFKRHLEMMCNVPKVKGAQAFLESLKFNALQTAILFRCPRILELGLLYDIDGGTMNRVVFEPQAQGVLVTFLPRQSKSDAAANDPN